VIHSPAVNLDDLDIKWLRARKSEKWRTYPADVLPLWVADMDFPPAEPIQAVLRHAYDHLDFGYPLNPTPEGLPRVFAERVRARFGWAVDPKRIEVITDVVQGIYIALQTSSQAGQGAIVQTPIYPPFLTAVRETGRRLIANSLVQGDSGYEIDFDALEHDVDNETRVLLLCNPHNPTGRAFTRPELESLAEFACRYGLTIVCDEIHADLVYPGLTHVPLASLSSEVAARCITLTSATKAFNIAGLRTAVAVFGSTQLQRQFNTVLPHARGGLGSLGLWATEAAWTAGQPWLDEVLRYLDGNRQLLARFVREHLPEIRHTPPQATYLSWLDCRALVQDHDPYRLFLEKAKVALSNGKAFGPGGDGFVRINLATSRAILTEALERMAKALAG